MPAPASTSASAPPAPDATPATSPPSAPEQPVAAYNNQLRSVDRSGPAVLGGLAFSTDSSWWRVDGLMPLHLPQAPQLRVGVSLAYDHDSAEIPELAIDAYAFGVYPTATYDWKLPIASSAGDFVANLEGGLGVFIGRIKIDQPYMPGNYETIWVGAMRLGASAQFRARAGYVISFQPFGVEVPVGEPGGDAKYEAHTETTFEAALLAGYQFQ